MEIRYSRNKIEEFLRLNTDKEAMEIIVQLLDDHDDMVGSLEKIRQWWESYPIDIFQEPDFKKVNEAMALAGVSLDAVAASVTRRVVEGIGDIALNALLKSEMN